MKKTYDCPEYGWVTECDLSCKVCGTGEDLYYCKGNDLAPLGIGATGMICGDCHFIHPTSEIIKENE